MAELNAPRFYERLGKIHAHFVKHRALWGGASCLSFNRGQHDESQPYLKSSILHQYLFGYELPDTILLLTEDGMCYIFATKKKCDFLEPAVNYTPLPEGITGLKLLRKSKNGSDNQEQFNILLKVAGEAADVKVGILLKESTYKKKEDSDSSMKQDITYSWEEAMDAHKIEVVDVAGGLSLAMAQKDEEELDLLKKSAVLTNKVLKHGFIPKIEEVIDQEIKIAHDTLATDIESIIEDPSKIKLKVPKEDVESCYFPIIQSGGNFDIKVSAQSSSDNIAYDIIMVSLGARYKTYCSNIARTFLIDPPKYVSDTYETLVALQNACVEAFVPGRPLKAVYAAAVDYLTSSGNEPLVKHLPKNLGFAIGLDFRDPVLLLSAKNTAIIRSGMVFNLSTGFSNVELDDAARKSVNEKSAVKSLKSFALLIADTIEVTEKGGELLTKHSKALTDISYTINEEDEEGASPNDDDEDSEASATKNDEALARKLSRSQENMETSRQRQSARLAINGGAQEIVEGAAERMKRQIKLLARRNEERLRELARANARNRGNDKESEAAREVMCYKRTKDYPDNVLPNQVKVDMANETVILPMCGIPVPFHIDMIKNVVLPDPDMATYLRINFYTPGVALGKEAPPNTVKLIQKHGPYATFIRELTFRSLDSHNLTQAFRQISELRKRVRQREISEREEANLVKQEKLIKTRDGRVPRLSDLTMRPVFSGRKTQGNLESHTNGLRFVSTRGEILEVMYSNVKHAIFQPCEAEIMVLIHFHLKNPIMVGKKKQKDIQFFTEVVDASLQVDGGRRSMYDPDEMDDEQRERQLRKKLNVAFKDFCKKVESVAKSNGFNMEFDIPYRDLGFTGTPNKEMVFIQPTLHCLINVTDTPFFVVDLSEVDHVHFERITFMSKAFDIVLINKDFTKQPWRVDMIPNADKDAIQEWLTDMELSYTEGPMNLNWKQIMTTVASDDRFYMDTEEDEVTPKEAGWEFLRMQGSGDTDEESEEEDDSEFDEEEEEEGSAQSDESAEESEFDSESSDQESYDGDEDLEEQGMDWDDMERAAAADDKRKSRKDEEEIDPDRSAKKSSSSKRSSAVASAPPKRRRT